MRSKRKFVNAELNHNYQRTISGFNIFYETEDYLVYYTIFSIVAKTLGLDVYGLCLMIDHIHSLITADTNEMYSKFMAKVTSVFVKEYNKEHGRTGALFSKAFGSAPKLGLKLIRTAIAYLFNNPVERHLCKRAQDYRWNFLAYAKSDHPFSDELIIRKASASLKRALQMVDGTYARNRYLTYAHLQRLFAGLDEKEKNQLIDYIIVRYNVIRYDILTTKCYDGYENMLIAINSNAGSEYEIKEHKWSRSDVEYRELYKYVHDHGHDNAADVITMSTETKMDLFVDMLKETQASKLHICKFLHLLVRFS